MEEVWLVVVGWFEVGVGSTMDRAVAWSTDREKIVNGLAAKALVSEMMYFSSLSASALDGCLAFIICTTHRFVSDNFMPAVSAEICGVVGS